MTAKSDLIGPMYLAIMELLNNAAKTGEVTAIVAPDKLIPDILRDCGYYIGCGPEPGIWQFQGLPIRRDDSQAGVTLAVDPLPAWALLDPDAKPNDRVSHWRYRCKVPYNLADVGQVVVSGKENYLPVAYGGFVPINFAYWEAF